MVEKHRKITFMYRKSAKTEANGESYKKIKIIKKSNERTFISNHYISF